MYFTWPTESEAQIIREYRARAEKTVEKLRQGRLLQQALEAAEKAQDTDEIFYGEPSGARAFLFAARQEGCSIPRQFRPFLFERSLKVRRTKGLLQNKLVPEEMAYQFILDHPDCFTEKIIQELKSVLKENGLLERNRVCLTSSTELKKILASSMGKLEGIQAIVRNEKSVMGTDLRMVILTDYIRGEYTAKIGSGEVISKMGAVPVFEMLRRSLAEDRTLGVLSGSTVILPDQAEEEARRLAGNAECTVSFNSLSDSGYSTVSFSGGNREKVAIVSELFRAGFIQVLIGTTALLGEGWDSPCANSLIIASFVGSFMLSNQMRGRVIRIDPEHPEKVSTIWHLITPDSSSPDLGEDFESVSRRFAGFLAPDFREDRIRNGIDRLGISPDMKKEDLEHCNQVMLEADENREEIRNQWERCLAHYRNVTIDIGQRSEASADFIPRSFCYMNAFAIWFVTFLTEFLNFEFYVRAGQLSSQLSETGTPVGDVLKLCLFMACSFIILFLGCRETLRLLSPQKLFRELAESVLLDLRDAGLIESEDTEVMMTGDKEGILISCTLRGGTLREKEIFADAIREMLSPMDSPRYIILRNSLFGLKGRVSFSIPSVLGKNGETAGYLEKRLRQKPGHCRVFYTRNEAGHRLYKKCVKRSFINYQFDLCTFRLKRQEVY